MRRTPRAAFVPTGYATRAYDDASIPIACHQVTTQASLSAAVIAALGLAGAEEVFEVGTGHGYQTALARLAGRVVSTGICRTCPARRATWPRKASATSCSWSATEPGGTGICLVSRARGLRRLPWRAIAAGRPAQDGGTLGRHRRDVSMPSSFVQLPGRHGFPLPEP